MELNEALSAFISKEILEEETNSIEVTDELLSSGLVNSMGFMRIVRFAEKTFKIDIPFEDMTAENFMTIECISNYVSSKLD